MSKPTRIVGLVILSVMVLQMASRRHFGEAFAYFLALLAWYVACLQQNRFDDAQHKIEELERQVSQAELTQKNRASKKSMLESAVDSVSNLKPGEWLEHCRESEAEEDKALGRYQSKDH